MSVSRRQFLKTTAAATAVTATTGAVTGVAGSPQKVVEVETPNKWRGRVAIVFDKNAVSESGTEANDDVIKTMVDDAVKKLSEGNREDDSVGAAWKAVFPSTLTAQSKICIKTNFYAEKIAPPPAALYGIVDGLRKMKIDGQDFTGDITIIEGNTGNTFEKAGYDASAFSALDVTLEKTSYENFSDAADGESSYAPALNAADFFMNVFSARGHDPSYTGGVSLGFKSHYGTYKIGDLGKIHSANGFAERVRNLHCTGVIAKKQVLSISCAFFCNNEGMGMGPADTVPLSFKTYVKTVDSDAECNSPSTIIMSTDAISCEMQAIKLLRLNKEDGGSYGVDDMPKYLKASGGVSGHGLSGETYDIGQINEKEMDIRKVINGEDITPLRRSGSSRSADRSPVLTASVIPRQGRTFFEFRLSPSLRNRTALLTIHDLNGRQLFSKQLTVKGAVNHFSWRQTNDSGRRVGAGSYLCTLDADGTTLSTGFSLPR